MINEARTDLQYRQYTPRRHYMTKHDVIGILLGVPVFLLGLAALGAWWAGTILLLVAIGLLIPSRLYDRRHVRAFGLLALGLTVTVLVYCAVILGWGTFQFISDPPRDGEMRWIMAAVAMFWCLIAFVLAASSIWVLFKKLKPKQVYTAVAIAVGIAGGLAIVLPMFMA
ncbi:MAG: hypothetical protein JW753_00245 [Dehalococcoidia bacterium]|nr:hypothetical protein [Dehalococcoidia bacterium]